MDKVKRIVGIARPCDGFHHALLSVSMCYLCKIQRELQQHALCNVHISPGVIRIAINMKICAYNRTSQGNGHRLECRITVRDSLLLVPLAKTLKTGRVHQTRGGDAIVKHPEEMVDIHQRRFDRFERKRFPVLTHDSHLDKYIRGCSPNKIRERDIPCLCNPLSAT